MERHFDEELSELHKEILRMGVLAQEAIYQSIEALKSSDPARAREVIKSDNEIDALELMIDEKCFELIARYQPIAGDLRFITTGLRINADLERIADLAVDIAQRVLELADKPLLKPLEDIPVLAAIAQNMVRDAITSFINKDAELARKVASSDSDADKLRNKIQIELINDYMLRDASTADRAVPLLLIARHLERICDHTTNIAEDVIYMVEARVIKHQHKDIK